MNAGGGSSSLSTRGTGFVATAAPVTPLALFAGDFAPTGTPALMVGEVDDDPLMVAEVINDLVFLADAEGEPHELPDDVEALNDPAAGEALSSLALLVKSARKPKGRGSPREHRDSMGSILRLLRSMPRETLLRAIREALSARKTTSRPFRTSKPGSST